MMATWKNHNHVSIQDVRQMFHTYVDGIGSYAVQAESPEVNQLETALAHVNNASFKMIHPLLINRYRMPSLKFKTEPMRVVGLDIETDHTNGKPMLLGFWHPGVEDQYSYIHRPTLKTFFELVRSNSDNSDVRDFITWGNLDIQCIIRLFHPTETERQRISRGISANIRRGRIIGSPPIMRNIGKYQFYISHYIPGRSLKLGWLNDGFEGSCWIFNCSQFYTKRIADTARGLGLDWHDFDKSTHLVNWNRFVTDSQYRFDVLESNKQDARIVNELAENLQQRFSEVFDCHPTLLVSTGSLTDAAVGRMLCGDMEAYKSNSFKWLIHNVWRDLKRSEISQVETLLAECFSAGYVDQFAVGYFENVCTADIAAAYPDKIRRLPDLRYSRLFLGNGNIDSDLRRVEIEGFEIETAIIRGRVTIPDTLKFHPITVKTYARENHRPTGTFHAAYTLEERRFCESYGATFAVEQYVIIGLSERVAAPIATVSEKLGKFRADVLSKIDCPKDHYCDSCKVLDGRQYLIKVVDNSIYGKTVMTTEEVQDLNGEPQITGYIAGDRFNMLYGSLITARTRIQIAQACMDILANGGRPVMTMTDSIYWTGTVDMLPGDYIRTEKTAGYFESPEIISHFYLLKTGQYEYQKGDKWWYKMRGLNVDREIIAGNGSFYRRTIKDAVVNLSPYTHPQDIRVMVKTRRLISIGAHDLPNLGAIQNGNTEIHPFVMSSKQVEPFLLNWTKALDGAIWLETPNVLNDRSVETYPLTWLRRLYEERIEAAEEWMAFEQRRYSRATSSRLVQLKRLYVWIAIERTGLLPPPGRVADMPWNLLEKWYGLDRTELIGERK